MTGENVVTENRLRCENIGSVFYSSIKPGPFVNSIQVVRKGAIILMNGDPFFISEYSVTKMYASNRAN